MCIQRVTLAPPKQYPEQARCKNGVRDANVLPAGETFCYGNAETAIISVLRAPRQSQIQIEVQYQQRTKNPRDDR